MPDPSILPATTARQASRAADADVSADRWEACSCWASPTWPWAVCSDLEHSALRTRARAARSVLLDEAAALTAQLVGSLHDGEAARLLQLVDCSPVALCAVSSVGGPHE